MSFPETDQHQELGGSISTLLNESTKKVTTPLAERGNPNLVTSSSITKLHHFTTHDMAMCKRKWLHCLDSYIEQSVNFGGQQRRAVTNCILVCNIGCSLYVPSQIEKFWACDGNKENLQLISRSFFTKSASENSKGLTVSGIIGDNDTCNGIQYIQYKDGITNNKVNLNKFIEEADLKIIPHIEDSIQSKNTRIVLFSNDADVLVLVL